MSSMRRAGRVAIWGCAVVMALGLTSPSFATADTLKRSVENMTQFPLDIVTSPWVAGETIYRNLQDVDDSRAVQIFYPIPGFAWNLFVQWGASVIRGVTGVVEFLPGLVLVFTDADMDPIFDPAVDNEALVDYETGIYDFKFGVNYTTPGY